MKTARQIIIDFALAIMFVVFIASGALKAIGTLALQPDRPLLAIILDWALLAVIAASIVFGAYGVRRIYKNIDAEAAKKTRNTVELNMNRPATDADREALAALVSEYNRRGY